MRLNEKTKGMRACFSDSDHKHSNFYNKIIFVYYLYNCSKLGKHWKKIYAKIYTTDCKIKSSEPETKDTVMKEIANRYEYNDNF